MALCPTGFIFSTHALLAEKIESHATLVSVHEVMLSSQMEGTILHLPYQEGHSFKKGDTLLEFDCRMQDAMLKRIEAQLAYAIHEYESFKTLSNMNAAKTIDVLKAKARVKELEAEREIHAYNKSLCKIIAPYDGVISKVEIDPYQTVRKGQSIMKIVNNDMLQIEMLLSSSYLHKIKPGTTFELRLKEKPNQVISCVIDRIIPQIDAISQSIKIIGKIKKNDDTLLSGMSGMVTIHIE